MKVKLKIDNMHCTSCAMNIDMDLEDLPGVKESSTSYTSSVTEVEFDANVTNFEQIVESIKKTGYNAQLIS